MTSGRYGPEWERRLDSMVAAWRARRDRRKNYAEAFRAARAYGLSRRYATKIAERVVARTDGQGRPFSTASKGEQTVEIMIANVSERAEAMTRAAQERTARRLARRDDERQRPYGAPW